MKTPKISKSGNTPDATRIPVTARIRRQMIAYRFDIVRAIGLALAAALIWCMTYNRWSVESWSTPLAYTADPMVGDVVGVFAGVRVARDGHFLPLEFTNIPELGAPYEASWNDYPSPEKPMVCMAGIFAAMFGIFAGTSLAVMVGCMLSAVSFYAACRILKCPAGWSSAGALIYAFSHYIIGHGAHHMGVAYIWHIPMCLVICGWMFEEEGITFRDRRFLFALAVAFVTAVQNVYYTNIFCQFVLFAGLLHWWRQWDWRAALPAASMIGTAAFGFLLMNANTFVYHLVYGPNNGAVVRAYKWLEIYGLKIVDLIIPPPDHHLSLFARFGAWHISNAVLPPGELPPTSYIGLIGIAALLWLLLASLKKAVTNSKLPLEAWMILWILIYAGVGGFNGVIGSFGFQLFRATTRYSIVVDCIVLMYAVKRLSMVRFKTPILSGVLAVALVFVALWDQLPPAVSAGELQETVSQVASDRHFTERMEQRLPPSSMIFQLPIMEFPESPAPGVGSYDHLRPYLYSKKLRYSFGSDKGRPREKWQQSFAGTSIRDVINRLESYGFAAIYINRNGFPDKAEGMLKAFRDSERGETIESERKDLVCVFLKPSPQPVPPGGGLYR